MIIQHNIAALNSHRQLSINNSATSKNLEKLSSGYRINRAGDDAAGLAISEKMRGQIRGLAKAEENTSHAINLIQTAEGGLQETHAILQRMRELAVQSANGTYDNPNDRMNLDKEVQRLMEEIDRISTATHYNGINLLDGTTGAIAGNYTVGTNTYGLDMLEELGMDTTGAINMLAATDYAGQKATLIFRDDDTVALQIGDKMFIGDETTTGTITFHEDNDVLGNPAFLTVTRDSATGKAGTIQFDIDPTVNTNTGVLNIGTTPADAALVNVAVENSGTQLTFQIGANGTADQRVGIYVYNMSTFNLKVDQVSVAFQDDANAAIEVINTAINTVSAQRAELGALQNRLEHTMNNLGVTKENLTSAESTIRDVDMAKEMMEYTKNSILVQASQAMLAQAQSLPQGVLQLLR